MNSNKCPNSCVSLNIDESSTSEWPTNCIINYASVGWDDEAKSERNIKTLVRRSRIKRWLKYTNNIVVYQFRTRMSSPLKLEVLKLKVLTQSCILCSKIGYYNVPIYLFIYLFGDDIVAVMYYLRWKFYFQNNPFYIVIFNITWTDLLSIWKQEHYL